MFDLTGRIALVTGASGGLGQAIARALHARPGLMDADGARTTTRTVRRATSVRTVVALPPWTAALDPPGRRSARLPTAPTGPTSPGDSFFFFRIRLLQHDSASTGDRSVKDVLGLPVPRVRDVLGLRTVNDPSGHPCQDLPGWTQSAQSLKYRRNQLA